MRVQFTLIREDGTEVKNKATEMADYIAALGIDGVEHELAVNGEKVVVRFGFDPPLVPKVPA